jgi:hypothetical protein
MPKNLQMPKNIIEKWEVLGFAAHTFRLLLLAPPVQTAWAEGFLQAGERRAIEKFAETEFGFAADSLEIAELKIWLDERPTGDLFEKMNLLLNEWLEDLPSDERNRWRKRLCKLVLMSPTPRRASVLRRIKCRPSARMKNGKLWKSAVS